MTPTMSATAKLCTLAPPRVSSAVSTSSVVKWVITERSSVWLTERLTTSSTSMRRWLIRFSRTRSKMTMVSLLE